VILVIVLSGEETLMPLFHRCCGFVLICSDLWMSRLFIERSRLPLYVNIKASHEVIGREVDLPLLNRLRLPLPPSIPIQAHTVVAGLILSLAVEACWMSLVALYFPSFARPR
jgi:hypothetical protein